MSAAAFATTGDAPAFDGIAMMNATSGWAWKGLSQLYRTEDGGSTWTEIHLQGTRLVQGASFLNAQQAWLLGAPDAYLTQAVYYTADGGKTWEKLSSLSGPNLTLDFHDPNNGWAINGMGAAGNVFYQVHHTVDGGRTWAALQPSPRPGEQPGPMLGSIHLLTGDSLAFTPPDSVWIASGYGLPMTHAGLTVSRDGGKTWEDVNPPLPADYVAAQPLVAAEAPQFLSNIDAYMPVTMGSRLIFYISHDGGNTWGLLPAELPTSQMLPRVQFVNANDGFAVCGPNLCTTQNGAATWQTIQAPFVFDGSGSGVHASQFDFVDKDTGWALLRDQSGNSKLVKTADGGKSWIDLKPRFGF